MPAYVNVNDTLIVVVDLLVPDRQRRRDPTQLIKAASDTRLMLTFQRLDVYRLSIDFLAFAGRLREHIPKGHSELIDQLRRAAQSTPQNIAEGAGKNTRPDKAKHYTIARGSAMECAACLDVMRVEGVIEEEHYRRGLELLERVVSMLTRMIEPRAGA